MKITRKTAAIIAALIMAVLLTFSNANTYMEYKNYDVTVEQIYSGQSSGKSSYMSFVGVFKTSDEIIFDQRISASTYSQIKKGDTITMELRPFDIRQDTRSNIIWFFGSVLLWSISIVTLPVFFIAAISKRFNNWMNNND